MKSNQVSKVRAIRDRIRRLEAAIAKGREYLESGAHAHWQGFRPLFEGKKKKGKTGPPHVDWVRNYFIPRCEMMLRHSEKVLERLEL